MSREWQRFEPVTRNILTGKRLFRSSAPNYNENAPKPYDASQKLTVSAVRYLQDKGIVGIISLNAFPYKYSERSLLYSAGIDYKHIPIKDFHAPTLDDIDDAWDFFINHRSTLVHCGYGWGRTGTMITALQLCCTDGRYPASSSEWQGRNHVEKPEQVAVLRECCRHCIYYAVFHFLLNERRSRNLCYLLSQDLQDFARTSEIVEYGLFSGAWIFGSRSKQWTRG